MQDNQQRGLYTIIDQPVTFGEDVYIGNYVHIRPGVQIGDKSEIRDYCFIAPDVKIGKHTNIYQFCNLAAGTVIGDYCYIGAGTFTSNDKIIRWPDNLDFKADPVIIENYVRIGMKVMILPGITLGEGCRIGAGAVVTRSTKPYETYIGNPAVEMSARKLSLFKLRETECFERSCSQLHKPDVQG